jgi:hypothetical protein
MRTQLIGKLTRASADVENQINSKALQMKGQVVEAIHKKPFWLRRDTTKRLGWPIVSAFQASGSLIYKE